MDLCVICIENDVKTESCCVNNHKVCNDCYWKWFKINQTCPICRIGMIEKDDLQMLAYSNIFNKKEILQYINNFILLWKVNNFFRLNNLKVITYFSEYELSLLTSAKHNKEYTLYRQYIDIEKNSKKSIYKDKYISSWTLDINVAKRFNSGKKCCYLIMTKVPSEKVFIDLNYLINDSEKEVILFSGTYNISLVNNSLPPSTSSYTLSYTPSSTPSSTSSSSTSSFSIPTTSTPRVSYKPDLSIFKLENREQLISARSKRNPLCTTIQQLRILCNEHKLYYNCKFRKENFVDTLIQYVSHTPHSTPTLNI